MGTLSKLTRTAALVLSVVCLSPSGVRAQEAVRPKRVLVLYWDERDFPVNADFEQHFLPAVRSSGQAVEFYSEYLESNRFPGTDKVKALHDYIQRKYADFPIDVVVPNASPALDFLLKYRNDLFTQTPIVFGATDLPSVEQLKAGAGATGIITISSYNKTLDLALRLHPRTKQVFIISTTPMKDKRFETMARSQLKGYERKAAITYLTDLTLPELKEKIKSLPERSIALYVWQAERDGQGKVLPSRDVLKMLSPLSPVPLYGLSFVNIGHGIVGGYVWTMEAYTTRLAEMALEVASGTKASNVPVEGARETPMFDWRELQRWGIAEDNLPENSVIRFREVGLWQQYKWRILSAIALFASQTLLIAALLFARRRGKRSRLELEQYQESLEQLVEKRTVELVEARDQAVAANRSKSTFLAHMSHELRTPLNAILGFSSMVRDAAGLADGHRKNLDIVNRSGEHLLGLIDEVLDVAKIEAGRATVEKSAFDVVQLVSDNIAMIRARADEKGLELTLESSPAVPRFIRSDAGKLRQVLINLLGNAVKFTECGSVTVRLDAKAQGPDGSVPLILEVEDTGVGIAEEDQARVFDVFVQVGNISAQKGTGLGLSITQQFAQILGGTIRVQSALGQGSRFRVELPVELAGESEVAPTNRDQRQVVRLKPDQPDYRILIVEDRKENWMLLQRLVEDAGFQVQVAEDGARGVEMFRTWRPHLIWMDIRLPVMGGMEAAGKIRLLDGGREVKIVALSASALVHQREEVLAAGLDDFLRKPFRREEIFDCIARHLGVRYSYEVREQVPADQPTAALGPALANLPEQLCKELAEAVITLDAGLIREVIDRVAEHDAQLGELLVRTAKRFRYSEILKALEECSSWTRDCDAGIEPHVNNCLLSRGAQVPLTPLKEINVGDVGEA